MEDFNNNTSKEIVERGQHEVAVTAVQAAVTAEIQSGLVIAKKFPRDELDSRINILNTCKRPKFAQHVEYSKPIGSGKATGLSVRAAEVAGNLWGNLKTMMQILLDDNGDDQKRVPGKRIINVSAMDLQTNTSYSTQAVIEKTVERRGVKNGQLKYGERLNSFGKKIYIVKPSSDEFEVKVAAVTSKLLRNNILRLIPEDIKEEMIETARSTILDKAAEDPEGERKKILDAFAKISVKPSDLNEYLGYGVEKCSPAEIVDLRVIWKTISDGQARWSDYIDEAKRKRREANEKSKDDSDNKKTAAEKIAEQAANQTPPPQTPPVETEPEPAPEQPKEEYRSTQEVIDAFRAAGDLEALQNMGYLACEVDPVCKKEVSTAFEDSLMALESSGTPSEETTSQPVDLAVKLRLIYVGLTAVQKTPIVNKVVPGNKTIKVGSLDSLQLEKLKTALIEGGHYTEDAE